MGRGPWAGGRTLCWILDSLFCWGNVRSARVHEMIRSVQRDQEYLHQEQSIRLKNEQVCLSCCRNQLPVVDKGTEAHEAPRRTTAVRYRTAVSPRRLGTAKCYKIRSRVHRQYWAQTGTEMHLCFIMIIKWLGGHQLMGVRRAASERLGHRGLCVRVTGYLVACGQEISPKTTHIAQRR